MSPAATATWRFGVIKESRALLPLWVGCAVTMGIAATAYGGRFDLAGLAAYALGATALGALSIGHEYGHHTLANLLSQPVRRGRLFSVKLAVLGVMLATLCALAMALFDIRAVAAVFKQNADAFWLRLVIASLPLWCGLLLAPWLTMVTRSTLAGFVFALAVPAGISMAVTLAGLVKFGDAADDLVQMYRLSFVVLWRGTLVLSAIAAFMSWRTFMRLQAVDGPVDHIGQFRTAPSTIRARRQASLWLLLKKELRLQQTTFVFTALYLACWLIVAAVRSRVPAFLDPSLFAITIIYGAMLALLIGSLGSAEERQAGTLEWQLLLPMAAWKQWVLKVGVLLSLALILTVGLPLLLAYVHPLADLNPSGRSLPSVPLALALIAATLLISLYVSTLSNSTVKSLLISLVVIAAGSRVLMLADEIRSQTLRMLNATGSVSPAVMRQWTSGELKEYVYRVQRLYRIETTLIVALLVIVAGLVFRFAFLNHRSGERGSRRILLQAIWVVGTFLVGSALVGAIAAAIVGAARR